MAIDLGHAIIEAEAKGAEAVIQTICDKTNGEILGRGKLFPQQWNIRGHLISVKSS